MHMRSKRFGSQVVLLALSGSLLVGCQSAGGPSSGTQEYFTWVDDQGRVQQSPIIREPEEAAREETASAESNDGVPAGTVASSAQSGSPTEQAADSEFNLENYPDGDQLERDGYIRPGEPQPYFSWRDAEGNIRVSYYQPDTRSAVEKGRIKPPVQLTPASIYQQGGVAEPEASREGGDPDAFAVLGIEQAEQSYLEQWAARCCTELETGAVEQWHSGREFGLTLDEASPVHRFASGDSPYVLVQLPAGEAETGFILRLRSFARDGLFVPSVAFLDRDMRPARIVTDLVAEFTPESWHRRGFLEAFIPVFPEHGERWLVIFTRDEDVRGQTVIEDERGPRAISHVTRGELSLTELDER